MPHRRNLTKRMPRWPNLTLSMPRPRTIAKREIPCTKRCGVSIYTARTDLEGWVCPDCVQAQLNVDEGPFAESALSPDQKIVLTRKSERKRLRASGRRAAGRSARGVAR